MSDSRDATNLVFEVWRMDVSFFSEICCSFVFSCLLLIYMKFFVDCALWHGWRWMKWWNEGVDIACYIVTVSIWWVQSYTFFSVLWRWNSFSFKVFYKYIDSVYFVFVWIVVWYHKGDCILIISTNCRVRLDVFVYTYGLIY